MNRFKFLTDAVESLNANKLRTALTMLGIVIGVASVVSMLAIGNGASSSITSSIESMGTNLLYVSSTNEGTNPQPITLADADAIIDSGGAPSVKAVAPVVQRSMDVTYAGASTTTTVMGVTPDYSAVRNKPVETGRFITQVDIDNHATVAVLGSDVVEDLFGASMGVLGQKIRIGSNLYQVVGILESKGGDSIGSSDNQVIVPISTAQVRIITRSRAHDEVSQISVAVVDAENVQNAITEVTSILRSRHDIRSDDEGFHHKLQHDIAVTRPHCFTQPDFLGALDD